jgi:hypothetical protein
MRRRKEDEMLRLQKAGLPFIALLVMSGAVGVGETTDDKAFEGVQAQVVLTVSEGKRLIAKAVAQLPVVKEALNEGRVIVAKGTTNTYVAEELLGSTIEHGAYVLGRTFPAKAETEFGPVESMKEVVLVNGKAVGVSLDGAVTKLEPGDVVIKGANALNYEEKLAGVMAASRDGGTSGKILPYITARKVHLIIPVGLEKQVSGDVAQIADMLREPTESLNQVPSMFLLRGQIVTEIEAIEILTDVSAVHIAAGGIGGAEGSIRLLLRGTREQVETALGVIDEVQGEPPFVQ